MLENILITLLEIKKGSVKTRQELLVTEKNLIETRKTLLEIRKELQAIRENLESSSEKEIHNVVKAINEATVKTGKSPLIV